MSSLTVALSGMIAGTKRLAASASNTANARSDGALPTPGFALPAGTPQAYEPVVVEQQSLSAGGVTAAYQRAIPAYQQVYDPSASYADKAGMVATPNVDPLGERVTQLEALDSYRANLRVLETSDRLAREAIDLKA